jgi:ketopantoate reductase
VRRPEAEEGANRRAAADAAAPGRGRPEGGSRGSQTKVLVVGAGAVGQVYGHALAKGGARVTYLVKPKHADEARRGFVLYPLNRGRTPVRWNDYAVVTEPEAGHDVVLLTIASNALRVPGFVEGLAARIGGATVVTLQPAIEDRDLVARHVPEERIVVGMIGLMAYFAPLPGEELPEPGVAYWVPPLGACPLAGPRAEPVARVLRAGGLPAKVQRDVVRARAFGGAVLETFVTALEAAGWDRRALVRDRELVALACRGAREAASVVERSTAAKRPAALAALCPFVARLGLGALGRLAPFDVATFFRVHYAKIAEQRRVLAAAERDRARELGVPTPALEALQARLERLVAA